MLNDKHHTYSSFLFYVLSTTTVLSTATRDLLHCLCFCFRCSFYPAVFRQRGRCLCNLLAFSFFFLASTVIYNMSYIIIMNILYRQTRLSQIWKTRYNNIIIMGDDCLAPGGMMIDDSCLLVVACRSDAMQHSSILLPLTKYFEVLIVIIVWLGEMEGGGTTVHRSSLTMLQYP